MTRPAKNRSAREMRQRRERAARIGRATAARNAEIARNPDAHPLMDMALPYRGYGRWCTPADNPPGNVPLTAAQQSVHAMIVQLAPLYGGRVPVAALYLEQQLRTGYVCFETGPLAVPDLDTILAAHPLPGGEPHAEDGDDDVAAMFHELHHRGLLYLDDDQVVRLTDLA
ncbi:hypothetical protein ACIPEL_15250 [Streptomyces griseoviridis]